MSVTVTSFIVSILAAYGLSFLHNFNLEDKKQLKHLLTIIGSFFVLGIIIWITSSGFDFIGKGDLRYEEQIRKIFAAARKELFLDDLIRYFLLIILGGGLIIAFLKKKLSFTMMGILLAVILVFDLINIQSRMKKNFIDPDKIEKNYLKPTSTDNFLLNDKEVFRIFPMGNLLPRTILFLPIPD